MSSLTRRIQRTVERDDKDAIVDARHHHGGRGSRLGVVNPNDPCRTGKRKVRKRLRTKDIVRARKPALSQKPKPRSTRQDRAAAHRTRMKWKAGVRAGRLFERSVVKLGPPRANLSRRHPDAGRTPLKHSQRKRGRML